MVSPQAAQESPESRMTSRQQKAFAVAKQAAANVIKRRTRVLRLIGDAYSKMSGHESALSKVREDFSLLLRMAKSWARRDYRSLPWKSLLYSVAAIVYFVNPADLIPDFIAMLGFVDDVAVIGAVVGAIRHDLDTYRDWEKTKEIGDGSLTVRGLAQGGPSRDDAL